MNSRFDKNFQINIRMEIMHIYTIFQFDVTVLYSVLLAVLEVY